MQDSTGTINENPLDVSTNMDVPDIAPFRYRTDPVPPAHPLLKPTSGNAFEKAGHLEPQTERRPVSIIKKSVATTQAAPPMRLASTSNEYERPRSNIIIEEIQFNQTQPQIGPSLTEVINYEPNSSKYSPAKAVNILATNTRVTNQQQHHHHIPLVVSPNSSETVSSSELHNTDSNEESGNDIIDDENDDDLHHYHHQQPQAPQYGGMRSILSSNGDDNRASTLPSMFWRR